MSDKRHKNLIPQAHVLTVEEQSMGGKASGAARREKANIRKMVEIAFDEEISGKGITHAQRLVQSALNIAENPKNGAAAIRAFEFLLHITGQDEPEPKQDAIDLLREILKANRENARIYSEQETT